jgi:hypothetical protein
VHPDDIALLRATPSGRSPSEAIAEALGVASPALRELAAEIWNDVDEAVKGINWWAGHPLTVQQRILVSDQIVMAAKYVEQNLAEARVHLSEVRRACEMEDQFMARAVEIGAQGPEIRMPERANALDWLASFSADVHTVGVFQALGSSLDCLAAVVIGVLALRRNVLKADLGPVRTMLRDPAVLAEAGGLRKPTADALDAVADDPVPGWLDWTLAYRNTLIHRPRPIAMHHLEPRPTLANPSGGHFIKTRDVRALASQPGLSDMEAMAQALDAVLEEEATVSLSGAVFAGASLVERVAAPLLDAWRARRANPPLLEQPVQQWTLPPAGHVTFTGFAPGSYPYDPASLTAHPSMGKRMRSAGVLDDERGSFW